MNKIITLLILLALIACKSTKTIEKTAQKSSVEGSNDIRQSTTNSVTAEQSVASAGQSTVNGSLVSNSTTTENDSVKIHRVELKFSNPDSTGKQHVVNAIITDEIRHRTSGTTTSSKASTIKNNRSSNVSNAKTNASNKSAYTDKSKLKSKNSGQHAAIRESKFYLPWYVWLIGILIILAAGYFTYKRFM